MILDRIENAARYNALHPGIKPAFKHLETLDLESMESGRHEIDGDLLFLVIVKMQGKGIEKATLESHIQYIDVQCTISGTDLIGWKNIGECEGTGLGYDEEKDLEFYSGTSDVWVKVPQGTFGIFFPEDVHAPLGSEDELFKVVLKIAVEW